MPADPFRRERRVVLSQGTEPEVLTAQAQEDVTARHLATDPLARAYAVGVKPLPKRDYRMLSAFNHGSKSKLDRRLI